MKEFIEKLIEQLEDRIKYNELCHKEFSNAKMSLTYEVQINAYKNAISIVNKLAEEYNQEKPTKTNKNQEWIPTAERLPEKNAIVLTCDKDGWISVNVYMPYAGVKNDFESGYYTAWMPLPPAYVPEEGRE